MQQLSIEEALGPKLKFNNQLTLLTLTAAQLLEVIEHGIAAREPGATPGQFAQLGGMAFSLYPGLEPYSRIRSPVIKDENGHTADIVAQNGQLVGDPGRTFRVVTLNFLADGGNSYPFDRFENTNRGGSRNRHD